MFALLKCRQANILNWIPPLVHSLPLPILTLHLKSRIEVGISRRTKRILLRPLWRSKTNKKIIVKTVADFLSAGFFSFFFRKEPEPLTTHRLRFPRVRSSAACLTAPGSFLAVYTIAPKAGNITGFHATFPFFEKQHASLDSKPVTLLIVGGLIGLEKKKTQDSKENPQGHDAAVRLRITFI